MPKALVLGSNSFGACHLIDDLLDQDFSIIGLSRSECKSSRFLNYLNNSKSHKFEFKKIDINIDFDQLISIIEFSRPNFIIDFAGQGMVAESWNDPGLWYRTNIVGKGNLYQKLLHSNSLERYIRVSTPEVYGNSLDPLHEKSPYNPSTPYALSHATIDQHLSLLKSQFDFPVVMGRFANFYGPGQQLYRIIPKTFMKFKKKQKLFLHGGGTSLRSFIHGSDVSKAIQKLMFEGRIGEIYHFSNIENYSILEVVEKIAAIMNVELMDLVETSSERPGKDHRYFMDISKSQEELDWLPRIGFQSGLIEVGEWINSNFDEFSHLSLEYEHVG